MLGRRALKLPYNFGNKIKGSKNIRFSGCTRAKVCKVLVPVSVTLLTFAQASTKNRPETMTEEMTLENILQNADQLYDENHYQEVCDVLDKFNNHLLPDIKWRKARALYSLSKTVKDKNERYKLIRESYEHIKAALEVNESNFAIHKWMAIILDAFAELDGIKSRVSQLENVKQHMMRAVELNPSDPTSWYLLGQFEYGLADMPWIQRKIVSTIFASPPTGTYEKALDYFEKAEGIKEGFYSMNWLMLGKCYLILKQTDNAKTFLEKAANCRSLSEEDKICKEEAARLLKKL